MAEVRACLYISVLFLCVQIAIGKPTFGLWCDFMCEDDDPSTTTASSEDFWDDLLCSGCEPSKPRATTPNPATEIPIATARPPMLNFMLPPNGINMTMSQQGPGGSWLMGFLPWGGAPQEAAPAATTPAAAAAATTAAAAATTAAAAATTAAPTTAAAGRK